MRPTEYGNWSTWPSKLSPGINDTTTAIQCLNYLTAILARIIGRKMESPFRMHEGRLRIIARRPEFPELVNSCLEQIRQNAGGNVRMLRQFIHALDTVAPLTECQSRRRCLAEHLEMVRDVIVQSVPIEADRTGLLDFCDRVQLTLR